MSLKGQFSNSYPQKSDSTEIARKYSGSPDEQQSHEQNGGQDHVAEVVKTYRSGIKIDELFFHNRLLVVQNA